MPQPPSSPDTAPAEAGPRSICVVMNPGAGSRQARARADALSRAFERHPGRFSLRRPGRGEDLEDVARGAAREGFDVVAAAGGDGTINAVAGALAAEGSGARLGVVPLGTFNYVARSLDLPGEIDDAVDLLAEGPDRPLPLGEINGEVFLNNASLGAYARILQTREQVYARWGRSRLAAHWSVIATLAEFRSPLDARVTVDGEERRRRTPMAFVANNPFQLEQFGFHDAAERVRAGEFALFMPPDRTRLQLIGFALDLALGRLEPGRDFELLFGREIVIETRRRRRHVARDGERARMSAPFRFRLRPDVLRVIAPEAP